MSYVSVTLLPAPAKLTQLRQVVELLGYQVSRDSMKIPNRVGNYFWYERSDYKSWTGVELDIYKSNGAIMVNTRSRSGRSYWDLVKQNETIKLIRDLFGGTFETDAGNGRYFRPYNDPPSHVSSGCYLARWRCHNALTKVDFYLQSRRLEGQIARDRPSGFPFIDEMNPRLLSNNLLVPYVLAVWEEYFRATFAVILQHSDARQSVPKKARLSHSQLESIAAQSYQIERVIADCFSFQRPSAIGKISNSLTPSSILLAQYANRIEIASELCSTQ